MPGSKGFLERLKDGDHVICAEGYLFEFDRRGYLKAGAYVPEVVLEHPDLVKVVYEEFVHAGSDIIEAFTYYGHRAKMQIIGREDDLEKLNRQALRIARQVADNTGTLMAGNISNTTIYKPNKEAEAEVEEIFKEQILWAVEEGADLIIGETYADYGEAALALECIKKYGKGLPAVVTLMPLKTNITFDDVPIPEACRRLEEAGAAVVGLNCARGPDTILPLIKEVRKACKGPIGCLPVPYRTDEQHIQMQDLSCPKTGQRSLLALDAWLCSRFHIGEFTRELAEIGVQYMGLCCGNRAHYTREMAEALGRKPAASKYTPDMSQHLSRVGLHSEKHSCAAGEYEQLFKPE